MIAMETCLCAPFVGAYKREERERKNEEIAITRRLLGSMSMIIMMEWYRYRIKEIMDIMTMDMATDTMMGMDMMMELEVISMMNERIRDIVTSQCTITIMSEVECIAVLCQLD